MSNSHKLVVTNASTSKRSVCLFQHYPSIEAENIKQFAWLHSELAPGAEAVFDWNSDYQIGYAKTVTEDNGRSKIITRRLVPMELGTKNSITISKNNGYYDISNPDLNEELTADQLLVACDGTVPRNDTEIAIAMANKIACTFPAEPNLDQVLTLKPRYILVATQYKVTPDMTDTLRNSPTLVNFDKSHSVAYEYTNENIFVPVAI